MIKNLQKIQWEEVVRNWAIAEAVSKRRLPYIREKLIPSLVQKLENEEVDNLSEEEWSELETMVLDERKELLNGLKELNLIWYKGALPFGEIEQLFMMKWKPFIDQAGSQKFSDLVDTFREGKMPDKHFEFGGYQTVIKGSFDINRMKGAPIVLSESEQPPYYLVEGFTRLSALLLSDSKPDHVPVILGVGRVMDWEYLS